MNCSPHAFDVSQPRHAHAIIREGRAALAPRDRPTSALYLRESVPITRLLTMLWHEDTAIQHSAALALAGGDGETTYISAYGHFTGTLLRLLARMEPPESTHARYEAVGAALRTLLAQNTAEIRAMSNMNYSFLSSALYLALMSTCRDGVQAIHRLRIAPAHSELCGLLWNLTFASRTRRLNSTDVEALMQMTGCALAALPSNDIPDFWSHLQHRAHSRRKAVLPALAFISDPCAVPYLTEALTDQTPDIAEPIIACLGRLSDASALPALATLLSHRNRQIRRQAQAAIVAIERAIGSQSRTLLRPVVAAYAEEPSMLLRSLPVGSPAEPPEHLLRIPAAQEAEA